MNHPEPQQLGLFDNSQTISAWIAVHEPAPGRRVDDYRYGAFIGPHDMKRIRIDRSGTKGVFPCYITPDEEAALLSTSITYDQTEALCKYILQRCYRIAQ